MSIYEFNVQQDCYCIKSINRLPLGVYSVYW